MKEATNPPRRTLPIASFLVAIGLCLPVAAQVPGASSDRKVRDSVEQGFWVVAPGNSLARIGQRFFPDDLALRSALRRFLFDSNPESFMEGDPSRLIAGARLVLPPDIRAWGHDRVPAAPPERQSPFVKVAAAAPGASPASRSDPQAPPPRPPVLADPTLRRTNGAARTPAPEETYVDRLIDEVAGAQPEADISAIARDESPGRRAWGVEFRGERREISRGASTNAGGIAIRHRRETERYGDVGFDVEVGEGGQSAGDRSRSDQRVRATFYHDNFALTPDLLSASALGVVRSTLPPWLASSWRVQLSQSQIVGLSTRLTGPATEFEASVGDIGRLFGSAVQGFERTSGSIASAGLTHRLDATWAAGINVVGMRGNENIRDHTAATLAVRRSDPATLSDGKAQAIVDDDGNVGGMVDISLRQPGFQQRLGGYRLPRDLAYGETVGQNDIEGAYWRGEVRRGSLFTALGIEYSATNLDRDPLRGGQSGISGQANFTLRLDRATTVGAGLSLRNDRPRTSAGEGRRTSLVTAYLSRATDLGTARIDFSRNDIRPESSPGEYVQSLAWNHDWPSLGRVTLNTLLTFDDEHLDDRRTRRTSFSVGARGPAYSNVDWSANLTFVDQDDPVNPERNYNSQLGLIWNLSSTWSLQALWIRNEIQAKALQGPEAPFVKDNTFQLVARWSDAYGTSYPRLGAAGRSSAGRIEGVVYYDENGDGTQQGTERGAPGVVVVLDGRFSQVTDREGRFAFELVSTGTHGITVITDKIPLPWGLADDSARQATVTIRDTTRVGIGLTRIAP